MPKASTPPIELQAQACMLNVDAQDIQVLKLHELMTSVSKTLRAIYAGWWLKEWGHKCLVVDTNTKYIFGGENTKRAWSWLKHLNHCKTMKTVGPAVGKLHCRRLKLNRHSVSEELLLTWPELPYSLSELNFGVTQGQVATANLPPSSGVEITLLS